MGDFHPRFCGYNWQVPPKADLGLLPVDSEVGAGLGPVQTTLKLSGKNAEKHQESFAF